MNLSRAGITDLAVVLALRKLKQKSFIKSETVSSFNEPDYTVYVLTDKAWDWILANEKDFILERRPAPPPPQRKTPKDPDLDVEPDDIPF
jgi:DNA-binding PadR family transcriptional regulator